MDGKEKVEESEEVDFPPQEEQAEPPQTPGRNWWAISGWIIGLLSVLFSIYFYFRPLQQTKELTYSYPYTSSKVFDSRSATTYKILDQNNTPITNDIYTTEFDLWNSGNQVIEPSDVRTPLRIIIFPAQRILEYKIVTQVRGDVANVTVREVELGTNPEMLARYDAFTATAKDNSPITDIDRRQYTKVLEVRWDHFDPGFGAKILITYVGQGARDKDFRLNPDTYIIGLPAPQFGQQLVFQRWSGWPEPILNVFYIAGFIALLALALTLAAQASQLVPRPMAIWGALMGLAVGMVFFALFAALINAKTPPPPFDIPSASPPVQRSVE